MESVSLSLMFIFGCTPSVARVIYPNINIRDTDSIGTI